MQVMKDVKGYLKMEELNRFFDAIDNERNHLLFSLYMKTGRRVSEIVRNLTPRDILWDEEQINWSILKKKIPTKKLLPVDKYLLHRLERYIKLYNIEEDEHIFKISRQRVFQLMRLYGKKSGIEWVGSKRIHPHHLRHSFAVHIAKNIKNPADLKKLQDLLVHSDIGMTGDYLQFNPEESRKLLERTFK